MRRGDSGFIGLVSQIPGERLQVSIQNEMAHPSAVLFRCVAIFLLSILSVAHTSLAVKRHFEFDLTYVNYTRNCVTKPILVVNGQYPGPEIHINEGDRLVVKVTNRANTNVTIHWHGIRQLLSGWHDGAAYITQCPIQPGEYMIYDFIVSGQSGTTLWHAHINWALATVHGAFITHPLYDYPFQKPDDEFVVVLGEWWNEEVEVVRHAALLSGGSFQGADAITINGLPGALYDCSESEGVTQYDVEHGKTYLLRVINAGLNSEMYLGIAHHQLTVVEVDSNYVKPFTVESAIVVAPGQTVGVLVTADQPAGGAYYMIAKSYYLSEALPPTPTSAIFQYKEASASLAYRYPFYPELPATNDVVYVTNFDLSLRSLHPISFPASEQIRHLLFLVGTGMQFCEPEPCPEGHEGYRRRGALNNISFHDPTTASLLEAFHYKIPGVYSTDFPDNPPFQFNNTARKQRPYKDLQVEIATRTTLVEFGTTIQLVLQYYSVTAFSTNHPIHPFHLHGNFFHVLGQGEGTFDSEKDPKNFNYYDPPLRFTITVPPEGWVAIRFKADNPGAWSFHCHFEKHLSVGMEMAFLVKNGVGPNETLQEPPSRLNKC